MQSTVTFRAFGFVWLSIALGLGACKLRVDPPPDATGGDIYKLQNCANCHGPDAQGTSLAPPLQGLAQFWTTEQLAEYLAEPGPFLERDERLQRLHAETSSTMGPYGNLDLSQRLVLARWLLAAQR